MQINKYNNTSFTARNYEIRRADNIMRNMLNQYPSRSTTKQRLYPIVQKGLVTVENFMYKTMNLMDKIRNQRIYVKDKNYLNRIISDTLGRNAYTYHRKQNQTYQIFTHSLFPVL